MLENLRKKVTQLEAGLMIDAEKGRTRDPGKQAAIADAEELRDRLQVGEERFFRFGLYLTIYSKSLEELDFVQHKLETILGQQLVYSKIASSQMESGFNSTLPQNTMVSSSLTVSAWKMPTWLFLLNPEPENLSQ